MLKVMLLEDDTDLCDIIKGMLISRGYSVFAFNSYKDALQCLESGQKFDIIFIDLVDEQEGVVGHKVVNVAKNLCDPITFVMSGSVGDYKIRDEDIDIFLEKPFSLRDLENSVEVQLYSPPRGQFYSPLFLRYILELIRQICLLLPFAEVSPPFSLD